MSNTKSTSNIPSFPAALTTAQVESATSHLDNTAIMSRALLAALRLDSDKLIAAWKDAPDAFMTLLESAPSVIDKAKDVVALLECSQARLMLTGEFVWSGKKRKIWSR
jgi:hypothetical protein